MMTLLEHFVRAFIPLFVAIDAIGLAAIFLAMSLGVSPEKRRRTANQAAWTGGAVALFFLFLGRSVFAALGITVQDFQIAGGLILFVLAARDLARSAAEEPGKLSDDFGVVPLGMPLIAGPALITTLLLLSETEGTLMTLVALAVNLVLVILALAWSGTLEKWIGTTGMRAVSKIVALLLAAIAVNMIRRGFL